MVAGDQWDMILTGMLRLWKDEHRFFFFFPVYENRGTDLLQEPITRSLHLPYKPSESTLSDEKLFIETVFGQNLSRTNA